MDLRDADLVSSGLINQRPGIDCTDDYSIYDYASEDYLEYPNEDRSFGGNSQNSFTIDVEEKSNDTKPTETPPSILDPPPLTTSKPSTTTTTTISTTTTTTRPSTGVASSDVLPIPSETNNKKSSNIVMTCLKMLLSGDEPLEGVNCINEALTGEFETFNFTSASPGTSGIHI